MKIKSTAKFKTFFKVISFFQKKYKKIFNSLYKQKLNSIVLHLAKMGVGIKNVYDIGAFKGEWTNMMYKTSLKKSNFFLFEANLENEVFLKKTKHQYFINVLSDEIKKVNFYSKSHTGDSYYLEKTNFYDDKIKPKIIETTTLDNLQKKHELPLPEFVKIDTQGSEIDILKGGEEVLKNCKIILLECPVISYNQGAPSFNYYIEYLNKINFLPLDITEVHHLDKVLVQVDIIFLKKEIFNKIYNEKKILKIFNP